jgi:hypothetical protein
LSKLSRKVRIVNGAVGASNGITSRKNAERYVAKSRAEWVDPYTIRFIETHVIHEAKCRFAERTLNGAAYDRTVNGHLLATRREAANIPLQNYKEMLLKRSNRRRKQAA